MENVWTKINNDIPIYMSEVCKKYNMTCEKLTDLDTVMYNDKCCLIFQVGKFDVRILYVFEENKKLFKYYCDAYLSMRFDTEDRKGVISIEKAGDSVKNDMIILSSGLLSKCGDVLSGEKDWMEKYKNTAFAHKTRLNSELEVALREKTDLFSEER